MHATNRAKVAENEASCASTMARVKEAKDDAAKFEEQKVCIIKLGERGAKHSELKANHSQLEVKYREFEAKLHQIYAKNKLP